MGGKVRQRRSGDSSNSPRTSQYSVLSCTNPAASLATSLTREVEAFVPQLYKERSLVILAHGRWQHEGHLIELLVAGTEHGRVDELRHLPAHDGRHLPPMFVYDPDTRCSHLGRAGERRPTVLY